MKRIFFVVFLGLIFLGCGKKEEVKKEMVMEEQEIMHHEKTEYHVEMEKTEKGIEQQGEVVIRKPLEGEIGKAVTCPVMGTKFKVKKNGLVADYKGNSYYLCCSGCIEPFKKNPEKYAE